MSHIVNSNIVLCLNSAWLPIGQKTVKDAFIAMSGGLSGTPPAVALDICYKEIGDGEYDFDTVISITPTKWEDWVKLPIRPFDLSIQTSKMRIRVPTVITTSYAKVPKRVRRLTNQAILERDGLVCQYSGKKLKRPEANIDHIVSKDEWKRRNLSGSPDTWTNMVTCDKKINHAKGNKSLKEVGLTLIKKPVAPPMEPCFLIKEVKIRDWNLFLVN